MACALADEGACALRLASPRTTGSDIRRLLSAALRTRSSNLGNVERLEQVVVSAELHRFDGGFGGAKGGDQNDGQAGLGRVQLTDQFQAVQARQLQIGDDDIECVLHGARQAVIAALFDGHLMAFLGQHPLQGVGDAGIVFDQQNFGGRVHSVA